MTEEQSTCAPIERAETPLRRSAKRSGLLSGVVGLGAFTVLTVVVVGLLRQFLPAFSGSAAVVLPAEFENHQALLLAWDHDVPAEPERALAQIVAASYSRTQVLVLVPDAGAQQRATQTLRRAGVPDQAVRFVQTPITLPWTRDYGPLVLKSFDGGFSVADFEMLNAPLDDMVPQRLATVLGSPARHVPLFLDGGNVLSNGAGLCLTTTATLEWNRQRGYDEQRVTDIMKQSLGAREVVFLEPLAGELTGHIDMFATLVDRDTVVLGQYEPQVDSVNARILDRNAERLSKVITPSGPLNVVRIPMPPRDANLWYTYTNVVYANGCLLMPSFSTVPARFEQQARAIYQQLLPHWEIVTIDSTALIQGNGSLHCATMNVYRIVRP